MPRSASTLVTGAVIIGVGLSAFTLGRLSAPSAPPASPQGPAPAAAPAPAEPAPIPLDPSPAGNRPMSSWAAARLGKRIYEGRAHPGDAPAAEPEPLDELQRPPELTSLLKVLQREAGPNLNVEHDREEALALRARALETRLRQDGAALQGTLDAFLQLDDPEQLEMLAAVLGQIRDVEVEEFAVVAAASDSSLNRRKAALQLLDGLDTPAARAVVVPILEQERDPELRRAALYALSTPEGTTTDEAQAVIANLSRALSADPDPETRRRAALQLADWHRDLRDLAPVIQALRNDASPDVRAGCAFALEVIHRRDPEIVNALVASIRDENEDSLVRELAWRALGRASPLPPAAAEAYAAFRDILDASREGR